MIKGRSHGRSTGATTLTMKGDRSDPEKCEYRIFFPGGAISVCRTSDNEYWAHISVNHSGNPGYDPTGPDGRIVDARLDDVDKHASETIGRIDARSETYHIAVRIREES